MRIVVFGRNGQVARCLQEEAGDGLVALSRNEADLMQEGAAQKAIAAHQPDIVINAAAYTAVDKAEEEQDAAAQVNANAPGEMALAAKAAGAQFIHLSSDYIFDGKSEAPYGETDAANPLNVYGQTKLAGEQAVLSAYPQAIIIRTSWVFSEFGDNFVKTMLRLGAGRDSLSIVADQIGGPTPARDIAKTLLTIAAKKHRGAPGEGIYHYQGAPTVSWAQFAGKIFDYAGLSVAVAPIPTTQYPTPATRPLNTHLNCGKIERDFGVAMPDWRVRLRQIIDTLSRK
ncbi:MAG: dTDP-4-dehydrorhamnose reductase [Alphaproteobacteria bacterium]|nr:dTDP-4-dehydrorhamnose reductase [Alphaproteobacteria bacterium]